MSDPVLEQIKQPTAPLNSPFMSEDFLKSAEAAIATDAAKVKDAPKPEDDIPASIKSTKAADDWKRLKSEHKAREETIQKSLDETTAKLKEALAKPMPYDPKEVEAWKKENEAMSEQLRLLAVERHPRFKAHFDSRISALIAEGKELAGEKGSQFEAVMKLPEGDYKKERLEELVSDLSGTQQMQLASTLRDIRKVENERRSEIEKAGENFTRLQAQMQDEQKKNAEQMAGAFKQVLSEASDREKGLPIFQLREGDNEWNQEVDKRIKLAEFIYNGQMEPAKAAKAALWSAAAPVLLANANALLAENQKLKDEIAAMQIANPRPGGGGALPASNGNEELDKLTGVDGMYKRAQAALAR